MKKALSEGILQLGLKLNSSQQDSLLVYVDLMKKWNKVFNLTAIEGSEHILSHHILDSLSVIPYMSGARVLDVGSGAGFPGIPLAIALPEWQFVLLDCNGKKTRFLLQSVLELGLENVEVVKSRLEEYLPTQSFDTVISRAFSSLSVLIRATTHVCAHKGHILAMKGRYPEQELQELGDSARQVIDIYNIKVPGLNAERHLVRLQAKNI